MDKDLIKKEPTIPGFGVGGFVICPFMSLTHPAQCVKQGCEMWVELKCGDNFVARCSIAWLAVLSTETRSAIEKLKEGGVNASAEEADSVTRRRRQLFRTLYYDK